MADLVETALALQEALDRLRAAKVRWTRYAGNPPQEFSDELLRASEEVREAVKALVGDRVMTCVICHGSGEIQTNQTWNRDPRFDESKPCWNCAGTGYRCICGPDWTGEDVIAHPDCRAHPVNDVPNEGDPF